MSLLKDMQWANLPRGIQALMIHVHDPEVCDEIDGCPICAAHYQDQEADRQYDSRRD